jgi:O-succinylbenzoic acid--CoA ligase
MYDIEIRPSFNNQFFFHPRFQSYISEVNTQLVSSGIHGHVCVLSSGTTSSAPKGYAISYDAMIESAQSVNASLNLKPNDRWGLSLPPYHIGGLSIYFRSSLLGKKPVILHPWDAVNLHQQILDNKVTVISLVPTQVYDLVTNNIRSPECIKAVLIGGDFFGEELEARAIGLGWPVIRTFGMTEVASQLATGGNLIDGLKILPHHKVKTDETQKIWVKSRSLFTCEFKQEMDKWYLRFAEESLDQNGYYPLPDRCQITSQGLIPLGRDDGSFKSSGHLLSLPLLKNLLDRYMLNNSCWGKMDLAITSDPRKGKLLSLIYEQDIESKIVAGVDELFSPIRVDLKIKTERLNKTELGKTILMTVASI